MKRSLFIASGLALVAGGLVYYFLSREKKQVLESNVTDDHAGHGKGERMLRHALHQSKLSNIAHT